MPGSSYYGAVLKVSSKLPLSFLHEKEHNRLGNNLPNPLSGRIFAIFNYHNVIMIANTILTLCRLESRHGPFASTQLHV